jgi:hypothetical protein
MRYANTAVLLPALVLTVLTIRMTPSFIEMILCPADYIEQRQVLRKTCWDTVAKYHARHGDQPVEEWPNEADKQAYTNAKRILAELEETKP